MSKAKETFWSARKYRYYRIGLMFLILWALTEIGVAIYFSRDGVIERNPGNATAAMPYLFEQMAEWKGRKVVFIGSSVAQGYGNCLPGTHFPALVGKKLREKYAMTDVQTFNLSSAGNRFGDHFGNMVASMRYRPDLFVCAIHVKMFSVHTSLINPLAHDEVIYYYRNEPDYFDQYRKRFRVSDKRYRQIWLDFQARKISPAYRYRGLISYFLTGNYRRPTTVASDWVKAYLGWINPILVESYRTNHEERNADYLWKVIPNHVVQLNYQHCEAFDFSEENINWQTFVDMCGYAQKRGIKLLFYLSPINRPFVDQRKFFEWDEVMPLFKRRTLRVARQHGHSLVDAVSQIDYRYFSDLDHLNMNGHEQMAEHLVDYVVRELPRR
ncbi:MAG: hypothetical protein ACTSXZ_03000 [Alphaproteobacteria bacterium]